MINIRKLFRLLSKDDKKKSIYLIFLILISAFLDVLGIASIIPLVAILSNPNIVESNILINKIFLLSNLNDTQIFLFYVGATFFIFFIISILFKALTIYFQLRFALMCEYTLGKKLLIRYLYQKYSWFLKQHSSNLAKNILSMVNQIIHQGLLPLFTLISQVIVIFFILILLLIIDPKLTLIVGLTLGIFYGIIYLSFKNIIVQKGLERVENDQGRYKALSDAFGSIKETKLRNLEEFFIQRFSYPAKNFAKNQTFGQTVSVLPRYLFEAIAFGGVLLIILYLMKQSSNLNSILPILSVYIFAGYRLMPAIQQLYSSLVSLRFTNAAIEILYKNLNIKLDIDIVKDKLDFKECISLKDITFNYQKSSKTNLRKISLKILAKSTVGFVGSTGSGKTTLADIILGLLQPQEGILKVDNTTVNKNNLASWQSIIGYVPQQIFLTDDSISANIAFGVDSKLVDHNTVVRVAKIANLHDFVTNELKDKYDTIIGERGILLSGGQRQRIGIARALYHNPSLLILDEATNALDTLTEKAVMDSVNNLSNKITTIIIAHRLNTVKNCDQIFLIDQGKVIAQGNYQEMSKDSKDFNEFISPEQ